MASSLTDRSKMVSVRVPVLALERGHDDRRHRVRRPRTGCSARRRASGARRVLARGRGVHPGHAGWDAADSAVRALGAANGLRALHHNADLRRLRLGDRARADGVRVPVRPCGPPPPPGCRCTRHGDEHSAVPLGRRCRNPARGTVPVRDRYRRLRSWPSSSPRRRSRRGGGSPGAGRLRHSS